MPSQVPSVSTAASECCQRPTANRPAGAPTGERSGAASRGASADDAGGGGAGFSAGLVAPPPQAAARSASAMNDEREAESSMPGTLHVPGMLGGGQKPRSFSSPFSGA